MRYLILVIAILFNLTLHAQTVFSEKPSWEDSFDGRKVDQTCVICNFAASKNGKVDAPVQKMYFHHL